MIRGLSYRRARGKARAAARGGDWPAAVRLYEAALSGGKGSARDFVQLGHAYRQDGCIDKAVSSYRQAIALDALDPEAYRQLGHVLIQMDERDETVAMFSTLLLLEPADLDAPRLLAECGVSEGRLEAVRVAASERLTQTAPAPDRLGVIATILLGRARAAARRGKWDLAAWRYQRLVRDVPGQPRLLVQYGHALKAQRRWDEAEGAYRRAAALAPDDVDPILHLAHILVLKNRLTAARHAFQRALRLDPDCATAAEGMDRIEALEEKARLSLSLDPEPIDLVAAPPTLSSDAAQILYRYQHLRSG